MNLLTLLTELAPLVIIGALMWAGTRVWLNRQRARDASLRSEIQAQVCYATTLDRASVLGKGVFGGRGQWVPLQRPRRLTVGTDAFIFSAPNALKEYVFRGCECSIAFSQAPSRFVNRDWIVITGQANGREVQLAITQDDLLSVWQALAGTGAAIAGNEVPAGQLARPPDQPVRSARYSLRWLAAPLVIVLIADAAVWLGTIALPSLGGPGNFGLFVAIVMFVVWFYRARVNADGRGWPQRRSPSSATWAWVFPLVNFFYPFQIMADIWRAGLPAEAREDRATLPGIWWACLLAFFLLSSFTAGPASQISYVATAIKIIGVLAEIMTALLVQKVSSGPLGRKTEPSEP